MQSKAGEIISLLVHIFGQDQLPHTLIYIQVSEDSWLNLLTQIGNLTSRSLSILAVIDQNLG